MRCALCVGLARGTWVPERHSGGCSGVCSKLWQPRDYSEAAAAATSSATTAQRRKTRRNKLNSRGFEAVCRKAAQEAAAAPPHNIPDVLATEALTHSYAIAPTSTPIILTAMSVLCVVRRPRRRGPCARARYMPRLIHHPGCSGACSKLLQQPSSSRGDSVEIRNSTSSSSNSSSSNSKSVRNAAEQAKNWAWRLWV